MFAIESYSDLQGESGIHRPGPSCMKQRLTLSYYTAVGRLPLREFAPDAALEIGHARLLMIGALG